MKSVKKNLTTVLAIILIILFFSLRNEFDAVLKQLLKVDIRFLLLSIFCIIVFWTFEAMALGTFVRKNDKTYNYLFPFGMTLATQFFNGITPFSSGGQPMQIYYMTRKNIDIHNATNICIQSLTVHQIVLVCINIIVIVYQSTTGFLANPVNKKLMWLGFGVNLAILLAFYAVSYMPRFNYFISNTILEFLHKVRVVKDVQRQRRKLERFISEYHISTENLLNNKMDFLCAILYTFLKLIAFNSIVYFIIRSTGMSGISYITAMMSSISVISVAAVIPSPGASGGAEYAFLMFFGAYMGRAEVIAIMLVWRFVTYYLGLIVGFIASVWLDKKYLSIVLRQ
ncbi:lysylphosphatidylglycerol synthase transmembrane domain-containing protein [Wukongibacter sp. M2B1]|uniref:lysylphosphatidylglycerol synthase transmembrane domain-containing protein n=1 Tax=Wukongibacter sp. M2B1 TaxID=3088895 RepID=UPI003D78D248